MQNEPNFQDAQMNVNKVLTKDYENKPNWTLGENEPKTNPIKPNFKKAQMNVNSLITKDYRKNDDFAVQKNKAKTNPISKKPKMNVNLYVIEDYREKDDFAVQKNKPNSNPIKLEANLSLRERRSLRVSFSESSNRGPISNVTLLKWVITRNCGSLSFVREKPIFCSKELLSWHFSGYNCYRI